MLHIGMKWRSIFLLFVSTLCLGLGFSVFAQRPVEDRVAFIIGNASYPKQALLKNPIHDAQAVERQLKSLGFETNFTQDLKVADVGALRQQMESRLKRDSVLVFYYAGHGFQADGRNYLLPTDANLSNGDEAARQSLYLGDVLHAIERMRPKIAVVILDACRDNPFKNQKSSNFIKQGLARVDPPSATVVFYATRPGGTALDGEGENGVFTTALLTELQRPNQPLEVIFRKVSTSVFKASQSEQEPWIEGVIRDEFIFSNGTPAPPTSTSSASPVSVSVAAPAPTVVSAAMPALPPTNQPTTVTGPITWHQAIDQIAALLPTTDFADTTLFACKSGECSPYKQWAQHLQEEEAISRVKLNLSKVRDQSKIKLCEFDLSTKTCVREDVQFTMLNLLMFMNKAFFEGFKLTEPKVTKSGGLSFQADFLGGSIWLGSAKKYVNCRLTEGRLEYQAHKMDFDLARVTCLGMSVSTNKIDVDVLLADYEKNEYIVKWRLSSFGGLAGTSTSGIAKMSF